MIYTISYDRINELHKNVLPILITDKIKNSNLPKYEKLIATFDLIKENEERFKSEVLEQLDVLDVAWELFYDYFPPLICEYFKMVNCPCWSLNNFAVALVYAETENDYSFKHIISEWFNNANIISCKEYDEEAIEHFFKEDVQSEMYALGCYDSSLIKEQTIKNAIKNNRSPKDVAWAICQ